MRFLLAVAVVLTSVSYARFSYAQDRVSLNAITRVEVHGNVLEISGSKKPSFTTFTLPEPPRLVIDFSEAVLQGVPADIRVNDGSITSIKTAAYGSASAAIARVVIGFEREVDTDISTDGKVRRVRLPPTPPLVGKAEPERAARAEAD